MRLLLGVLLSAVMLAAAPGSVSAAARHDTSEGEFVQFNPCTNEEVLVTATFHYLVFQHGDLTHSSRGDGIGLTTGMAYVYVRQGFETNTHGFFEVVRLISVGPASDMTLTDNLSDSEDPLITCS